MKRIVVECIVVMLIFSGYYLTNTTDQSDNIYKAYPEALKSISLGSLDIDMNDFGEWDGVLFQSLKSNDELGALNIVPSKGWEVSEVKCYLDNDTEIQMDGNYTLIDVDHQSEDKAKGISGNDEIEAPKCRTNLYIELENEEKDEKAKFVILINRYNYLVIDFGEMIPDKTEFVFNIDYNEGGKLLNGDWTMTYVEEGQEGNLSVFSSKEEFLNDYSLYVAYQDSEDFAYIEEGDRIIIKVLIDSGLRSVKVVAPGKGTDIKLIENAIDEEVLK